MTSKKIPARPDAPAVEEAGGGGHKSDHERMSAQRDAVAAEIAEMKKVNGIIRDAINARQAPEEALLAAGYTPVQVVDLMEPTTGSDGRQYSGYPLSEVTAKERFLKVIEKMLPKLAGGDGHSARVQGERRQGGGNQVG